MFGLYPDNDDGEDDSNHQNSSYSMLNTSQLPETVLDTQVYSSSGLQPLSPNMSPFLHSYPLLPGTSFFSL